MRKLETTLFALFLCIFSYGQTEGDLFFGSAVMHEIRFTFHQANYWDSLDAAYNGDYYIKGDVEIDGTMLLDCGLRFKGNSSYNGSGLKKSFKIDMNEFVSGQEYDGLKKLNLNNCFKDPSFLREKLMNDFLRDHGLHAPRVHFSNVYINDTLWGLYTAVEEVDVKKWLQNNIGDDRGNMFKGDPHGDLRWYGSMDTSYYSKYTLKTNETQNDWSDLVNLINVINNTPVANLQTALDTVLDTDNYIHTWAVHTLFSNLDSYMGSGHNYYIYHDSTSNKFKWVTWDVNEAFGNFNMGMNLSQIQTMSIFYLPSPATNRPLNNNMLQVNSYKQALADAVCQYAYYDFSNAAMDPVIDSLANFVRTSVYADPNKFFTSAQFETNLTSAVTVMAPPPSGGTYPGLKDFITTKRDAVTAELTSWGCNVGVEEQTPLAFTIFPNPATDHFFIGGLAVDGNYQINIYNSIGQQIHSSIYNGGVISIEELNGSGIYLVEIADLNSGKKTSAKLIRQ